VTGILVRRADVGGRAPADVRIAGTVVSEIGRDLASRRGEEELDARGGALIPGLCDHHLHLYAIAAAAYSVQCGPPQVTEPARLAAALAAARPDEHGWIRGVGYSEDVAGPLDAAALDLLHAARPVRLQHRSGALWIVNTAGARALGLEASAHPGIERNERSLPTGRLWRADDLIRDRLPRRLPPDLRETGVRLARAGITHVTDATPDVDETTVDALSAAMESGALPQHVHLLGAPTGWRPQAEGRTPTIGPFKIILADSGFPDFGKLTGLIQAVHDAGRAVAAHRVTREALILLAAALDETGSLAGDRVEHGALIPAVLLPRLRSLGLCVVSQPGFVAVRGDDYLRDLPEDRDDLYRARSLLASGVGYALSSDAPYGPLDPWTVMAAAVHRRTPSARILGTAERLTPAQALDGYLSAPGDPGGAPRRVAPCASADLVVLRTSLEQALAAPGRDLVDATVIGGRVAWSA
jgi:predicted amidohydrolase YtcJ